MASAEEKRAAARERARRYRARKREREDTPIVAQRDVEAGTAMRDAVESSLGAMKWLASSDDATVAQARMLAEQVDLLTAAGATTKALTAHSTLNRIMTALAGTPTVRLQHELRALRAAGKTEESDDDEQPRPSNVSELKRPTRRRPA